VGLLTCFFPPAIADRSVMKRASSVGPVDRKKIPSAEHQAIPEAEEEENMEFEDDFEDDYEHEEIIDAASGDEEEFEENVNENRHQPAPSVFRPGIDELEDGQVLEPEPGTYKMLHRLEVQWPCLSFDVLPDALGDNRTKFPMTAYVVSGTQADNADKNKLVIMKWANLQKTNKDGLEDEDEEDEIDRKFKLDEDEDDEDGDSDNDQDPDLEFRMIKHAGGVNRVRAMPQMSSLVASWSDNGSVYVHNIFAELEALEGRGSVSSSSTKPVHAFSGHSTEGFAMGWNPHQVGQLVTGDCNGHAYLWSPASGGTWNQSRILQESFKSFSSIEDIEFRKTGDKSVANIFAVCGGQQGKVGIVDVRNPTKAATEFVAHEGDTNVLSWNPIVGQLLLTGGDDGSFKVWDVRATSRGALANFKWHRGPVTSVDWHPRDEAVLAVSSEDDTTSIWDMSVEEDEAVDAANGESHYPPQLLFLHMGQKCVKEIKFHRQMPGVVVSTALDGFNIFKTFNII
jgi:ribosome assembly protein RRB1